MFYVSAISCATFFVAIMVNIAKNRYGSGFAISPLVTGYIISFLVFIILYFFGNVDMDPDPFYYTSISRVLPPVWILVIAGGSAAIMAVWAIVCCLFIGCCHNWIGCVCKKCGAMRDIGHEWAYIKTTTRTNCNHANRGSGQYNDPCYGASCDDCEHTVLVYICSRCGATKDEYQ